MHLEQLQPHLRPSVLGQAAVPDAARRPVLLPLPAPHPVQPSMLLATATAAWATAALPVAGLLIAGAMAAVLQAAALIAAALQVRADLHLDQAAGWRLLLPLQQVAPAWRP